jgi:multidrug efflux pump subunit AcrB
MPTRWMLAWMPIALLALTLGPARSQSGAGEAMIEVEVAATGLPRDTVATRITPAIESRLGAMSGLSFMVSWTRAGESRVVLKFKPGVGESAALEAARQQVAAALAQLSLPASARAVRAIAPEQQPTAYIAFMGDRFSLGDVSRAVEPEVREMLQVVVGVARVRAFGLRPEAGRIHLDRPRLAAYGIGVADIRAALAAMGIEAAPGEPDSDEILFALKSGIEPSRVGDIIVTVVNGVALRLKDLARVERGVTDDGVIVRYNGEIALLLEVARQPKISEREAARALHERLPDAVLRLPAGLSHKSGFSCERCVAPALR